MSIDSWITTNTGRVTLGIAQEFLDAMRADGASDDERIYITKLAGPIECTCGANLKARTGRNQVES